MEPDLIGQEKGGRVAAPLLAAAASMEPDLIGQEKIAIEIETRALRMPQWSLTL